MKRGFIIVLSVFLIIGLQFASAADPYDPAKSWHRLQQVSTDETGAASVDANADGVIDRAASVGTLDGDASLGDGTTNAVLKVKGATTLWSAIDFYSGTSTPNPYWGIGRNKDYPGTDYRDNDFYIDRSGVRRALTIDESTLNVGIDTDNPQQKLHVNGNALVNQLWISSGAGDIKIDNAGSANTLAFHTSGAERMRINNLGNVGIGTANPEQKLHINGGNLYLRGSGGSNPAVFYLDHGVYPTRIEAVNDVGGGASLGFYTYLGPGYTENMHLKAGGNVGIGTTNPGERLDVNGNAIIAGRLKFGDGGGGDACTPEKRGWIKSSAGDSSHGYAVYDDLYFCSCRYQGTWEDCIWRALIYNSAGGGAN